MLYDVKDANVPVVCDDIDITRVVMEHDSVGIIPAKSGYNNTYEVSVVINNKLIFIDDSQFEVEDNAIEFLSQSIIGKRLFVPIVGGCSWLPLRVIRLWQVSESFIDNTYTNDFDINGNIDKKKGSAYVEVEFEDETCIADIVCNAYKYYFDISSYTFKRHPNPEWNLIKYNVRKDIDVLSSGTADRIADYGRIILFLLSKVELSEEEKHYIEPLLAIAPTASDIAGMSQREALIQRFVSEAKASPSSYLKWKKSWGKFWWETE